MRPALLLPLLLVAAPLRAADTLRVSLTRDSSYRIDRPTVIQFLAYDSGRVDTVRFEADGRRPVPVVQKMMVDLHKRHGLRLTCDGRRLVELDKTLALPARLVVKPGPGARDPLGPNPARQPGGPTTPQEESLTGFYFDDAQRLLQLRSPVRAKALLEKAPYFLGAENSNRFLSAFLASLDSPRAASEDGSVPTEAQGLPGLVNPTTAIDALGTFIANRFRQEVAIAYLDRMRTWLDASLANERVLFPATHQVLSRSDPFEYTTFLTTLREAFGADLQALPPHAVAYLDANRHLLTNPDVRVGLKATLHVVDQVRLSVPPLAVARQLDQHPWLTNETPTLDVVRGLRLFASLARGASRAQSLNAVTLVSADDLKRLENESLLRNGFLGLFLLGEKAALSGVSVGAETVYDRLTAAAPGPPNELFDYFLTLHRRVQGVKTLRLGLDDESLRTTRPDDFQEVYFQYLEAIRQLVEVGVMQAPFLNFNPAQKSKLEQDFLSSQQLLQATKHVAQKKYGLALTTTVAMLQPYLPGKLTPQRAVFGQATEFAATHGLELTFSGTDKPGEMLARLREKIRAIPDSDRRNALLQRLEQARGDWEVFSGDRTDWFGAVMKYGNFMVTALDAKTSQELAAALDAAALPVGSYRIKRNSVFSLALNAYGGLYAGSSFGSSYQPVTGNRPPTTGENFVFGPSAPVGITFGWGSGRGVNRRDGRFWGFSVPLLDVGAVFAFRLLDKKTELPELSWRNVFTPGLYLVHSPKWLPALALSAGVQYGPELRGVKLNTSAPDSGQSGTTQAEFNVRGWRVGGTITVDIPLVNLYTRYEK